MTSGTVSFSSSKYLPCSSRPWSVHPASVEGVRAPSPDYSRTMRQESHRVSPACYRSGVWSLTGPQSTQELNLYVQRVNSQVSSHEHANYFVIDKYMHIGRRTPDRGGTDNRISQEAPLCSPSVLR